MWDLCYQKTVFWTFYPDFVVVAGLSVICAARAVSARGYSLKYIWRSSCHHESLESIRAVWDVNSFITGSEGKEEWDILLFFLFKAPEERQKNVETGVYTFSFPDMSFSAGRVEAEMSFVSVCMDLRKS